MDQVFETFGLATEATPGTLEANPTHMLPMRSTLTPRKMPWIIDEQRGTLEEVYRSKIIRKFAEMQGEGPCDLNYLPLLAQFFAKGGVTPTQPSVGTDPTVYLWTYVPTLTDDDLKAASAFFGDNDILTLGSSWVNFDEFQISSEADSDEGAKISYKGQGLFPSKVTPTNPAYIPGEIPIGPEMSVYLDTSSGIGTSLLANRVVSVVHKFPTGITRRRTASGSSATLGHTRTGRRKRSIMTEILVEVPDQTEYDLFAADTTVKLRVLHNGPIITNAYRHYVEVDTYGPLRQFDWGESEGGRLVKYVIQSHRDATLGASWRLRVQNTKATI